MILYIQNIYNKYSYYINSISIVLLSYNFYKFKLICENKCITYQITNTIPHPYMTDACYETNVYGKLFNNVLFMNEFTLQNFIKYMSYGEKIKYF